MSTNSKASLALLSPSSASALATSAGAPLAAAAAANEDDDDVMWNNKNDLKVACVLGLLTSILRATQKMVSATDVFAAGAPLFLLVALMTMPRCCGGVLRALPAHRALPLAAVAAAAARLVHFADAPGAVAAAALAGALAALAPLAVVAGAVRSRRRLPRRSLA